MNFAKCQILQHDQSDCGIACLLSIIQYHGGVNTLENLRRISGTNSTGTTLLGLYQASKECGFNSEGCEADMKALAEHGAPVILHLLLENKLQHYVVCYSTKQTKNGLHFIIGDPAKGIIHLSEKELDGMWQSKTCLTLSPNNNFIKASFIKKEKIKWIKNLIGEDAPLLGIATAIGIAIAILGLSMVFFSQRLIDDNLSKEKLAKIKPWHCSSHFFINSQRRIEFFTPAFFASSKSQL